MGTAMSLVVQRRRYRVAVPLTVAALLTFGLLLLPAMPDDVGRAASSTGLGLVGVVGMAACLYRARLTSGRRRRAWLLIMTAGALGVLGNVWTAVQGIDPVREPSLVSDLSVAGAMLLAIVGLLNFPSARRRRIDVALMALDGLVIAAAVMVIATVVVYAEVLAPDADEVGRLPAVVIPSLDAAMVTVALLLVLRSGGADRPPLALVGAGFLMYAVADLAYAALLARGTFEFGTLVDLGWIAGYLLIGLAAWHPGGTDRSVPVDETPARVKDTALAYVVLLVAALVQVVFATDGRFGATQAVLWLVLVVAVGTRQSLLTYDNAVLRRGLEQRVQEQTADLRRLARRNEVLLTSVGDGLYGVDGHGCVTFVNPSGARALGYQPEELLGRHAHDVFHAPADGGAPVPWERCYIAGAIDRGSVTLAEGDVYRDRDGRSFPVEVTATPLLGDDEVRGAVVAFRDVTQRREVDRIKSEFLSVVSHELRTPLTSIRASLGLLAGGTVGELPPRAGSLVSIALESSERLTRLINDLLDLERIEGGSKPLDLAPHEAGELVAGSVTEMEGLARSRQVRLEQGGTSGRVVADRDRIVQTLTNLLNNAIKYSEPGGVVTVTAREEGTEVVFAVRDDGRGIPEDKLESVFERFAQVDSSDARQKGGTGLGLAISREIVHRHGGRIWADSVLGAGTTVSFTLPTGPPPAGRDAGPGDGR